MNRSIAVTLFLALALPASALAKEPTAVKVCGKTQCHGSKDKQAIAPLVDGGPPTEPPSHASGWYTSTIAIGGEGPGARFTATIVPSQGLIRSETEKGTAPTWMTMSPGARHEYAALTAGLEPRSASTLTGVVEAPAHSTAPSAGDAPVWPWLLGAAFAIAAGITLVLRRRTAYGG
jgi:hypothetical protein